MTLYTKQFLDFVKENPDQFDQYGGRITRKPHADAWKYKSYEPLKPMIKASKRSPSQMMYVDTTKLESQSIPTGQIWMFTLPVLVLAVILIGGRK